MHVTFSVLYVWRYVYIVIIIGRHMHLKHIGW